MGLQGILIELREGLRQTRPYLLAHHRPAAWDRCYAPTVFGRRIRLCARCLGIYPGIISGFLAYEFGPTAATRFPLILLLPVPALVDWAITAFTARPGSNGIRTLTGGLLGYAYGLGLLALLRDGDLRVLGVGAIFGVIAALLLVLDEKTQSP